MSLNWVKILRTFISILIPILLIIGSVRLIATSGYLSFEYGKSSFPTDPYGFGQSQRFSIASANIEYVRNGLPIQSLADQRLGNTPLYNERELKHMQDVQDVFQITWKGWIIGLLMVILAGLGLLLKKETRPSLPAALKTGGIFTIAIVTVIGLFAILAWQLLFVIFHEVFFAAGTWTFSNTDTLIRLFPEKFWFDAAVTISGLSLVGGLALALIGWLWEKEGRPKLEVSRLRASHEG